MTILAILLLAVFSAAEPCRAAGIRGFDGFDSQTGHAVDFFRGEDWERLRSSLLRRVVHKEPDAVHARLSLEIVNIRRTRILSTMIFARGA